ncbi:MAG TPA: TonB-dependent receptor, partial [Niabella sp.]|nr:TonB-dependent receptor [Niabella sp.]
SSFGSGKQDPLILIDGVESSPTDMARLQPDDISDFSVLKDAAASAVYGARGANGVVLINTKSGKSGVTKFNFRAETRMSRNTQQVEFADNITYMETANEAVLTRNRNGILPYTQNKINGTREGRDPYLYPDNNWLDQLVKKNTLNYAYNLGITGGTQKARYYVAGTYNIDNGILKVNPINDFNNNIKLRNYSLRTNVNLNLTSTTELIIRMYGQFDDYTGPIGGGATTFTNAIRANPVMFPAVYPASMIPYLEHPLFGSSPTYNNNGETTNTLYTNPYAELVKGYSVFKSSNIQPQIEIKQDLRHLVKGLRFTGMGYLRRYSEYRVNRSYNPFFYQSVINPVDQSYALQVLNDGSTNSIGVVGTEYLSYNEVPKVLDSRMWLQGSLDYNQTFGKHAVSGMVISYLSSYEKGNNGSLTNSLPQRNIGISRRFTYGFDNRYLIEFNFGYNGSERFALQNRFGFFPSFGIGYRVSNEKFFEPLLNVISDLKFRATLGLVGNDQIGDIGDRFFYLSNINLNNGTYGASFGKNDGTPVYNRPGISISRYANEAITWEKSRQINIGMDLRMFNDELEIIADIFHQYRTQILRPRSYTESAAGFSAIPFANYGEGESKGLDMSVRYQKTITKNLWANVRGTFTYSTNKKTVVDELRYDPSIAYLSMMGYPTSQTWGYIAERLFVDQDEVDNAPVQFGNTALKAGDIKYRDINNDGVINADDRVPIGLPTVPEIIYGFGTSMGYKKFDFGIYFQGAGRTSFFINANDIQPFNKNGGLENGLLKGISESHWTEDNRNLYAFWPRLSTYIIEPNNVTSTWWMRNGSFLRLKSLDAGYSITNLKRIKIDNIRVYFSATNLHLWSRFKMW